MTYCSTLARPLLKKINQGKTLDEIGAELCGTTVKNPRKKAIRLIRELLGQETLIEHAATLKYDIEMAILGKIEKSTHTPLPKIEEELDTDYEQDFSQFTAINVIRELIKHFSIDDLKKAIAIIEQENEKVTE